MRFFWVLTLLASGLAQAGPIVISQVGGFLHGNGGLISQLDNNSPGYFSTLDTDNLGTFGWAFTNTSGSAINNPLFLLFLDADIDNDLNTFFNEYGTFLGLTLPPGAPPSSIAASSWEIDEPGFVFGDIFNHLITGALDNINGVQSGSPDDVSLALGFAPGTLAPGQTLTVTGQIRLTDIGGLSHTDPASNFTFFFNGYATVDQVTSNVPEPSTLWTSLVLLGLVAAKIPVRSGR